MRDARRTVEALEAKAADAAVTEAERAALLAKATELREAHPELFPPPPPPPPPITFGLHFTVSSNTGGNTGGHSWTMTFRF